MSFDYTECIVEPYVKHPRKKGVNENDEDGVQRADGVLSNILELYGGRTLEMKGPSRSDTGHADANGERPNIVKRRSFLGRRLSISSIKTTGTRHDIKEQRREVVSKLASVLERQDFVLKFAKALLLFGSPSHRIEDQLESTCRALNLDGQFLHLPGMVICSFGDAGTRTSETYFVKSASGVALGTLKLIHELHNDVTHGNISAAQGTKQLVKYFKMPAHRSTAQLIMMAAAMGFIIAMLSFKGSVLDACAAGAFNLIVQLMQEYIARRNPGFQPIFEISVALLVSFGARALSSTNLWCYNSVVSSGLVGVLPGMTILAGALELGSRKIISGSVKVVYAVTFSLFLGFGITIGSDLYLLADPTAITKSVVSVNVWDTSGSYDFGNGNNGTWTFTNSTLLDTREQTLYALQNGKISCYRDPSMGWWLQAPTPYLYFLWVPVYALLQCLSKQQPFRSWDLLVMWAIAVFGYTINNVANTYIFAGSDITSFTGALAVSAMGGIFARLFGGTAYTMTLPGILFLVPGGLAAVGGLAMTQGDTDDTYVSGIQIGLRMIQTAIGIVVGVFTGAFVTYGLVRRKTKDGAVFAF